MYKSPPLGFQTPDTDRLAALLHKEWDWRFGEPSEPGVACPDCETTAARLITAGVTLARPAPDAALREALTRIQDICKPNGVAMSGRSLWDGGAGGNKQRIWELCEVALADPEQTG